MQFPVFTVNTLVIIIIIIIVIIIIFVTVISSIVIVILKYIQSFSLRKWYFSYCPQTNAH